jgi:hypothetical protein
MSISRIKSKKECPKCGELFTVGEFIPLDHYKECGKKTKK